MCHMESSIGSNTFLFTIKSILWGIFRERFGLFWDKFPLFSALKNQNHLRWLSYFSIRVGNTKGSMFQVSTNIKSTKNLLQTTILTLRRLDTWRFQLHIWRRCRRRKTLQFCSIMKKQFKQVGKWPMILASDKAISVTS